MVQTSRFEIIFDDSISKHFTAILGLYSCLEEARQRVYVTGGISLEELRRRLDVSEEDQA